MATERVDYEDSAAFEKEFEPSNDLAKVVAEEMFDGAGNYVQPEERLGDLEYDDAEEYELDGEYEQGEQGELTWQAINEWWPTASEGQRHDLIQSLSVEDQEALLAQYAQSQTDAQLGQVASFHEDRQAYQMERAAMYEQQAAEVEVRGTQVFESWVDQARQEERLSMPAEELGEMAHGWLDFQRSELVGQGYDLQTAGAYVFTPENIAATLREVAAGAAETEKVQRVLGKGPYGGSWVRP